MKHRILDRGIALTMGVLCHGLFGIAIVVMAWALYSGLRTGQGSARGAYAWLANVGLTLQFPMLHSFLLSRHGRTWLGRLFGRGRGTTLAPTTYVLVASLQLLLVFGLWSPSGVVWWRPEGLAAVLANLLYAAAWLYLIKAIADAGMGLQTGWIGWTALLRGNKPNFGCMPTRGLFRSCRQPIYFGFLLLLWTAPCWTPDRLLLAVPWSLYCVLGPLLKERRFVRIYGDEFARYRQRVPYFVPAFFNRVEQP